jgi:hypothetical protein
MVGWPTISFSLPANATVNKYELRYWYGKIQQIVVIQTNKQCNEDKLGYEK